MEAERTIAETHRLLLEMYKVVFEICESHGWKLFATGGSVLGAVRHKGFIPWDDDMDLALPREQYEEFARLAGEELPGHIQVRLNKNSRFSRIVDTRYEVHLDDITSVMQLDEGERAYLFIDLQPFDGTPANSVMRLAHSEYVFFWRMCHRLCNKDKLLHTGPWRSGFANFAIAAFQKLPFRLSDEEKYINKYVAATKKYSYRCCDYIADYYGKYRFKDIYPKSWWEPGIMADFEDVKVRIPSEYDKYLTQVYGDYMVIPKETERMVHMNGCGRA